MKLHLTHAGVGLLLRALDGEQLAFTHVELGNGEDQGYESAEALGNTMMTVAISDIDLDEDYATLKTAFNNSGVSESFRWTELGVFARDPDDSSAELLYAYGYESPETADNIKKSSDEIKEMAVNILVFIGDAGDVTAIINESLVYATKAQLDEHTADQSNPHGVTKAQVGLGSVPNLHPQDAPVEYTEPDDLTQTYSGSAVKVLFGRCSKAIRSLISHLADNLRHVTQDDRNRWDGKANAAHNHSAANITSGTLGAARGGTGCASLSEAGRTIVPYFFAPVFIGSSGDANNLTEPGWYSVAQGAAHVPSGAPNTAGFLLAMPYSTNTVGQLYISYGTGTSGEQKLWFRLKIDSSWNAWT